MKKLLFCFGTRPEAIKMAPLIAKCKEFGFYPFVCLSGQHKDMIKPFTEFFNIKVDYSLDTMKSNQSLSEMTSSILQATTKVIEAVRPDYVIVQGDTTTTFASGLAAFYQKIPIVHIEAGLRTNDILSPFPEEANRKFVSQIAKYHFAPTEKTKENLNIKGIKENVFVTGNTSIDALKLAQDLITDKKLSGEFQAKFDFYDISKKMILITTHRRENHGNPLNEILDGVKELAIKHNELQFVLPVHLNPNVKNIVKDKLSNLKNVFLLEPLNYPEFVWFMEKSFLILTDSGGVQEEGPYFKKPILVLRENTERPEGVTAKTTKLVGSNKDLIISEVEKLLKDKTYYSSFQNAVNPYGDGSAAERILKELV